MKYFPFFFLIVLITSCGQQQPKQVEEAALTPDHRVTLSPAQMDAANITLGKVERRSVGTTLHVNGALDIPPQSMVTVSAPMGGFVRSTKLLQGMKVRKGEVLATLEHQDYIQLQQDYLEAKSRLLFSETEFNRQVELAKENVNAQKSLQQARSQYDILKATVSGLEAKLSMINVSAASLAEGNIHRTINLYSPINGYVTEVNINLGQYVNTPDVMFKIVNIEHLHAELQVYEKDINSIQVGQKVLFELANESTVRAASVYLIGKEISPERTVRIHCHLEDEDEKLLPGMYITASIETALHEADVVPAGAVVNFEGRDYIFTATATPGQFQMVALETDNSTSEVIEVTLPQGFDKNSAIVTQGAFELLGLLKNVQED